MAIGKKEEKVVKAPVKKAEPKPAPVKKADPKPAPVDKVAELEKRVAELEGRLARIVAALPIARSVKSGL